MQFYESVNFGNMRYAELSGIVLFLIVGALFFDFLNGFHDAANSVATVISTRVLSPRSAIAWAAFFQFRYASWTSPLFMNRMAPGDQGQFQESLRRRRFSAKPGVAAAHSGSAPCTFFVLTP